jgi:DNA-binding NarL/FixJ family response regulator
MVQSARPSWQLRSVHSTRDALIELRNRHFDVLVTDIDLGGRSGLQLLEIVHRDFPHVACVVHSAQVETYAGHPSLMRATALVHKPGQARDLVAALTDALWATVRGADAGTRVAS